MPKPKKFTLGHVASGGPAKATLPAAASYSADIYADSEHDNTSVVCRVYGETAAHAEARRDFIQTACNRFQTLKLR